MSHDKRWRLVCYDIRDPKRYRKAYKLIRGRGETVQYSIFRCFLDAREVEELRWQLERVLDKVDRLLVIDLCPGCAATAIARNHVEGWQERPPAFRIVGTLPDHAPAAVAAVALADGKKPGELPRGWPD
jgi:CRISPR-associated protein Cas2